MGSGCVVTATEAEPRSSAQTNQTPAPDCTLFVDLDGTLTATDSLWESAMLLCRRHPLRAALLPFWLRRGKAHLKQRIAEHVLPDPRTLPYREDVLEFLRQQKQAGRRIVLAAASNERVARAVAEHVGLFDAVVASDGSTNLSGRAKLRIIQQHRGDGGAEFDYIGDSRADVPVWAAARGAYLVGPSRRLLRRSCPDRAPRAIFPAAHGRLRPLLRTLRPRQWVKNSLVLLPLVLAQKVGDLHSLQATLIACLAFCLCASSMYIVNDLLDIEADRAHPRKRLRPFAAGTLPIPVGLAASAVLIVTAFALAALVNHRFFLALLAYLFLTTAYSVSLKGKLLLDVFLLAGLYTHRIIAGTLAADIVLTPWLLAFSMFFFISLAFSKRYTELTMVQSANEREAKGRGYRVDDLGVILSVGPTSGYLAVVVFCLYISSDVASQLYERPQVLWLICPVLLYWITRVWFFAGRHALVDDPVVFALRDHVSWMAAGVTLVLMALAAV